MCGGCSALRDSTLGRDQWQTMWIRLVVSTLGMGQGAFPGLHLKGGQPFLGFCPVDYPVAVRAGMW